MNPTRPTITREACSGLSLALLPAAAWALVGIRHGFPYAMAAAGLLCLMGALGWIKLPWFRTRENMKPKKAFG